MHALSVPSAPPAVTRVPLHFFIDRPPLQSSVWYLCLSDGRTRVIYILPTHSHIGYSNTSHAWLASLLTRISSPYWTRTPQSNFFNRWSTSFRLTRKKKKKKVRKKKESTLYLPKPPHPRIHSCPSPALLLAVRGCLIKKKKKKKTSSHHPGGQEGGENRGSGAFKTRHRCWENHHWRLNTNGSWHECERLS